LGDHATGIAPTTIRFASVVLLALGLVSDLGARHIWAMVLAPELYKVAIPTFAVADLWDHWADPIEPLALCPRFLTPACNDGFEKAPSLPGA
jgi:hypothetical protein